MPRGTMPEPGDVILAQVQFTDSPEAKTRPALVLFEELGNIVIAGITSNIEMKGIPLTEADGLMKKSVIKLNYIFTISSQMAQRRLFRLNEKKRKQVYEELVRYLSRLQA